jgi:hypothetical protein
MSALSSPDLHGLLEMAIKASKQLNDHLSTITDILAGQPQLLEVDVEVLREKYRTVNRYIQFGDETARWVGGQTVLAADCQTQADGADLIRRVKDALERANGPAPSFELIEAELGKIAAAVGQPYTEARIAWMHVLVEAFEAMEAELQDFDHERMVGAVVIAMCAFVEYASVNLLPAKYLRSELTRRLHSPPQPGSRNDSGPFTKADMNAEAPGGLSVLLSAPDLARILGQPPQRVETFLRRLREDSRECFMETNNPRPREPKYLYRTAVVWPALQNQIRKWEKLADE